MLLGVGMPLGTRYEYMVGEECRWRKRSLGRDGTQEIGGGMRGMTWPKSIKLQYSPERQTRLLVVVSLLCQGKFVNVQREYGASKGQDKLGDLGVIGHRTETRVLGER